MRSGNSANSGAAASKKHSPFSKESHLKEPLPESETPQETLDRLLPDYIMEELEKAKKQKEEERKPTNKIKERRDLKEDKLLANRIKLREAAEKEEAEIRR